MKGHENHLLSILIANRCGWHKNPGCFRIGWGVVAGQKFYRGIHFRAQVVIRVENLHLYLNGCFLPVRLGGNLVDHAVVFAIGVGVYRDDALLLRTEAGEVILRDVKFDLDVVQVGQGDHLTLRAAFRGAGKLRRHQLAFFRGALENRAADRSTDHGGVQP